MSRFSGPATTRAMLQTTELGLSYAALPHEALLDATGGEVLIPLDLCGAEHEQEGGLATTLVCLLPDDGHDRHGWEHVRGVVAG